MSRIDTSGSHYVRHLRREKPTFFWKDPAQESSGGLSAPETIHEAPSKSLKFLFGDVPPDELDITSSRGIHGAAQKSFLEKRW